ncbi:MAG: MTAP family purine nucleoside phosphorylase [Thermoplasmata archaeon]|nr:MTAP family purine nucleoside phosphorylase [Thermoplasmata archaeon]
MSEPRRTVGLIGGSGIAEFFGERPRASHRVSTPWGPPSGPIEERIIGDLRLLFLPRHGVGHTIPPHRVNYRANVEALCTLGADAILTLSSVGSLSDELPPGTLVLPNQFVDFTKLRPTTFFDGGKVFHVSTADPFCPDLTARVAAAGEAAGHPIVPGRTYVCVEGPRFSTRAESRFFRTLADVIGMTLVPEVTLARERARCYVCLAMVTDFDVWAEQPVDAQQIVRTMRANAERVRQVFDELLPRLSAPATCACARALEDAAI